MFGARVVNTFSYSSDAIRIGGDLEQPTVVAVVGYGYWGPNILRNFMELPTARVKWVCDARAEQGERIVSRFPSVLFTTSIDEVLADDEVEAVLIATPISTHFALAMRALEAGKHVFVEKPMATTVEECDQMAAAATEHGLKLMVGHTFVYSPPVRAVKRIIDSGELGDVYFITSSRINLGLHQRDVSVIWDLMPHDASILHYWLDDTPSIVSAIGRSCINNGIPDVAFVSLEYARGVVASLHVSWLSPVKIRRTMVVGSKRMLVYDDTESVEKVKVFDHGVDFREPEGFGEFQLAYRTGDIVSPRIEGLEPLRLEASHFIDCIQNDGRVLTDATAGRSVVSVLAAADASIRTGQMQRV
jgi:predicted dehydrogenase